MKAGEGARRGGPQNGRRQSREDGSRRARRSPTADGADGKAAFARGAPGRGGTGVDLGAVTGSGPGGKVTKEDVLAAADGNGAAAQPPPRGEAKPLRGPAAMLAKAMDESRAVPTATSFRTIAVDTLDAKRKAINARPQRARDEGLLHPPGRLGDRRRRPRSGR